MQVCLFVKSVGYTNCIKDKGLCQSVFKLIKMCGIHKLYQRQRSLSKCIQINKNIDLYTNCLELLYTLYINLVGLVNTLCTITIQIVYKM